MLEEYANTLAKSSFNKRRVKRGKSEELCDVKVVSQARPFTDSCPLKLKGLVTCAHTFSDFPHDLGNFTSKCIAYRELCLFYTSVIQLRIN